RQPPPQQRSWQMTVEQQPAEQPQSAYAGGAPETGVPGPTSGVGGNGTTSLEPALSGSTVCTLSETIIGPPGAGPLGRGRGCESSDLARTTGRKSTERIAG